MQTTNGVFEKAADYKSFRAIAVTFILFSTAVCLGLLASNDYGLFAAVVCAYSIAAALWIGRPESLAVFWLALSPIASYFLRWPIEQSLLTFDRAVVFLIMLSAAARLASDKERRLHIGAFEICWLLFGGLAAADCFRQSAFSTYNLKIAIDGFLLPLPLFIAARRHLDPDRIKRGVLFALIALGLGLLPIGVYELITSNDLLHYSGSDLFWDGLIRPNGPFSSNNSYAVISLLVALALIYWPAAAGLRIEGFLRVIRAAAIASALLASLVPQFRAVAVAAVLCLTLGRFLRKGARAMIKPAIVAALLFGAALPVLWLIGKTEFAQRRIVDPSNAYSRIGAYRFGLMTARDNLARGVGLGLYKQYYDRHYRPIDSEQDLSYDAMSIPHNNYITVLAELGILGFIFYASANLLLLYESFRLWKRGEGADRERGAVALVLFTAYNGIGLTLTSGYYSDLNLMFFFLMGILLNGSFGNESDREISPKDQRAF